ncbi:MAG TPA: hypothetical protein VKG67_03235 [Gallionellaceae bacterium]|nr:hypothetical protein [Gallionellaceae bacterium]
MAIPVKHRRWLLGAALLLTVAASVGGIDNHGSEVVQADTSRTRVQHRKPDRPDGGEQSMDILLDKLKRPALAAGGVKDLFAAKSWYVPPPSPKGRQQPSAPPVPFVYIGMMVENGSGAIVFLGQQDRVYAVKEGDSIEANYRVDEIKAPVMILTYLPLGVKQTLQIGEAN